MIKSYYTSNKETISENENLACNRIRENLIPNKARQQTLIEMFK